MLLRRRPLWRAGGTEGGMKRPQMLRGEDLPPAPKQKRSLEKRSRLKKSALAVFGAKGYEGASIGEIAEGAGLAIGGFYQHYRSKRQLLLALMDELLQQLEGLDLKAAPAARVRQGLRALLSRAFSADLAYLGAYRAWQEATLSDGELAAHQREIFAWTHARITALFGYLAAMPGARRDLDVQNLARVIDQMFWSLLAQASQMRRRALESWLDAAVHLIYHGLFTDPRR